MPKHGINNFQSQIRIFLCVNRSEIPNYKLSQKNEKILKKTVIHHTVIDFSFFNEISGTAYYD